MTSSWSPFTRRVVALLLLAAVFAIFWLARSVMSALLIAAFIAFLINPLVNRLQREAHIPRFVGALLVLLIALGLFALIIVILAPIVIAQFGEIRFSFAENLSSVLEWLRGFLDNFRSVFGYDLSPYIDDLQTRLQVENLQDLAPSPGDLVGSDSAFLRAGTGALASVATAIGGFLFSLVLVFVFIVYLINDLPVLSSAVGGLIPEEEKPELEQLKADLQQVWYAFIRGNLLLMGVFGFMVGVTMYALGMPSALLLGVIAALMELIPTVGAFIAGTIMVGLALFNGSAWIPLNNFLFALLVVGVYAILQWVEGNLLQPKIMGGAVQLPGFISILAILVGLAVAGILGAYLAIPVVASAREIFLYLHRKLTQPPPDEVEGVVRAGPVVGPGEPPLGWLTDKQDWSAVAPGGAYLVTPRPMAEAVSSGLLTPTSSWLPVDGPRAVRLNVVTWRAPGTPLVALHGLTANAHAFGGLAFGLRDRIGVVAPDLRGRGHSESGGPYGLERHVADVLTLLDQRGLETAVLVGHSYGASIALLTAARHPDRVERLVLVDGGGPWSPDVVEELRRGIDDLSRGAPSFSDYVRPIRDSGIFEEWNFFIEQFYRMDVEEAPGVTRSRIDPAAVAADLDDFEDFDPWRYAERLTVPALVLHAPGGMVGSGRPVLREEDGRRLADLAPGGRFVSIAGASHSSILYNRYEEVADELAAFLRVTA